MKTIAVTWENAFNCYHDLIIRYGYKSGDEIDEDISKVFFSPVLLIDSDNYLNIKYESTINYKIYTKEEVGNLDIKQLIFNEILKKRNLMN